MKWRDSLIYFRCWIFRLEGSRSCSNDEFFHHCVFSIFHYRWEKVMKFNMFCFCWYYHPTVVVLSPVSSLFQLVWNIPTSVVTSGCGARTKFCSRLGQSGKAAFLIFPVFFSQCFVVELSCFSMKQMETVSMTFQRQTVCPHSYKKVLTIIVSFTCVLCFFLINPKAMTRCLGSS